MYVVAQMKGGNMKTMSGQKQLSLCVITKNDESFLPGCLYDFNETADEELVIDLGSNDGTVELAKQAGAEVCRVKWEDNFSKVKNYCMNRAAGKWILFLRPDETISREQHKELGMLLQNPAAEAYFIKTDVKKEKEAFVPPQQNLRLLRSRPNYRYRYRSFEYIPDEELYSVQNCGLHIASSGESSGWQAAQRSRLLQTDIDEHPQDSYLRYIKGVELLNRGEYKESAASLELARHVFVGGYLYTPHLYKCLGSCFLALKRYDAAEEVLDEGFWLFPFYIDLLVLRAEMYNSLGRTSEAAADLETCLELLDRPNASVPPPQTGIPEIKARLSNIRAGNGKKP